jgi:hypothetical protein
MYIEGFSSLNSEVNFDEENSESKIHKNGMELASNILKIKLRY